MTNYINTNPVVIRSTRESLGIDLMKASEMAAIPLARLKRLESNEKPDLLELKALARAYKCSIAALLLEQVSLEKPLPKDMRTVESSQVGSFDLKTILAVRKARVMLEGLLELKEELGIPINRFPHKSTITDDPIQTANNFRKVWAIEEISHLADPNLAHEALIEKVESLGVAVFQLPLTKDNLRGFSIIDEKLPIVVIKRGDRLPAKNFTLFHEVAHILLNLGGICDIDMQNDRQMIEKWCNQFAAELLVPSELLLSNPIVERYARSNDVHWEKKDLVEIGNSFFVGPLVILRRLLDNNRTLKSYYDEKHAAWNKPAFGRSSEPEGRNIPKEIIREKGRSYVALALQAFDQNRISLKDLADYLDVKLSYVSRIRQMVHE